MIISIGFNDISSIPSESVQICGQAGQTGQTVPITAITDKLVPAALEERADPINNSGRRLVYQIVPITDKLVLAAL